MQGMEVNQNRKFGLLPYTLGDGGRIGREIRIESSDARLMPVTITAHYHVHHNGHQVRLKPFVQVYCYY